MVITDLNNPDVNYYAICGKWLDKEKDDGLISRDLDLFTDLAEIRKGRAEKLGNILGRDFLFKA